MSGKRTPEEIRPPRMEPLARLPVFFALDGKRAVVGGGIAAAAWKAELLSAAGAAVAAYADNPGEELKAVAADPRARPSPSAHSTVRPRRNGLRPRRAVPAFRSMSSTSRPIAILPSGRSSTARHW